MKKKFVVAVLLLLFLTGTALAEEWYCPDCDVYNTGKYCTWCGNPQHEHQWLDATCTKPQTCAVCGHTFGTALGHDWYGATCTEAAKCARCNVIGEPLAHDWIAATCTEPAECRLCGAAKGSPMRHSWSVTGGRNECEGCGICRNYITLGSYKQTSSGTDSTPIEWQMLATDGEKVLLISRYILNYHEFNRERPDRMTWSDCSLRAWLNGEFFNTIFDGQEKKAILETAVDNGTDKVFLLSDEEASRYFNCIRSSLECEPTGYASLKHKDCRWWLRTGGEYANYAAYVDERGRVDQHGRGVDHDDIGIRPAVWVDLSALPEDIADRVELKKTRRLNVNDIITLGEYAGEPIEWRVVEKGFSSVTLLSVKGLDAVRFNNTNGAVTWSDSTLRTWLNSDFVNAVFPAKVRAQLAKVILQESDDIGFGAKQNMEDIVWLPSIDEVNRWFGTDAKRVCYPTQRAEDNDAYESTAGTCRWWLRSPGFFNGSAACVLDDGSVYSSGYDVNYGGTTIRPAIVLRLS